ncbi:hypothetical protein SRHO_G00046480 [Serrasalmus rhombeus]
MTGASLGPQGTSQAEHRSKCPIRTLYRRVHGNRMYCVLGESLQNELRQQKDKRWLHLLCLWLGNSEVLLQTMTSWQVKSSKPLVLNWLHRDPRWSRCLPQFNLQPVGIE